MCAELPDGTTRSIHDNHVLGYSVDAKRRSIVLHTEFRFGSAPFERTDVKFEGVLGYHFQDSLGGILFDVGGSTSRSSSRATLICFARERRTAGRSCPAPTIPLPSSSPRGRARSGSTARSASRASSSARR
jgi:hypothetical protein